ncbi:MAG: rhomboid family protein [Bryobacteraceae bacterium]
MTPGFQQRCWNHEDREAVCRCPQCGRSYCRECVSEHESRLLCAACLKALAGRPVPRRRSLRRLAPAALALAGIVTAWAVYFAGAEVVMTLVDRSERSQWQSR